MANGAGLEAKNVAGALTSMGIGEMISKLAVGIAEGQLELDTACMEIAQFMGEAQVAFGKRAGTDEPDLISLVELGFTPNFYQFVDTILEVRVAVSSQFEEKREVDTSELRLQQQEAQSQSEYEARQSGAYGGWGYRGSWGWGGWGWGGYGYSGASSSRQAGSSSYKAKNLQLTTVDAKYASTYNYAVEASSLVKTKIVPVPPPNVFEEVVRAKVQQRREDEERLRLTEQVNAILPALSSSAQAILDDPNKLPDSDVSVSSYQRASAVELQDALTRLQEDYGALTTEHWTIIRSVQDREVADAALADAVERTRQILGGYPDESPDAYPSDTDVTTGLLSALAADLGRFQTKIDEIRERLAPPEEAKESSSEETTPPEGGG